METQDAREMNPDTELEPRAPFPGRRKFPLAVARAAGEELLGVLAPVCEPGYCCLAGSLRREKPEVKDAEILFVPKFGMSPAAGEIFKVPLDLAEQQLLKLTALAILRPRLNARGHTTWGALIKLGLFLFDQSGESDDELPVDFFTATKENWWNYLVCRTGPAESNVRLALAARARGWKWEPYSSGFVALGDVPDRVAMTSERAVFEFVGLPYHEPKERQ